MCRFIAGGSRNRILKEDGTVYILCIYSVGINYYWSVVCGCILKYIYMYNIIHVLFLVFCFFVGVGVCTVLLYN